MPSNFKTNKIWNQDALKGMHRLPANIVDLVLTDPPFAIEFQKRQGSYNRKKSNVLKGYQEIQGQDYAKFTKSWMRQAHRVLKPEGSLFVFSGWNGLESILTAGRELGFHAVNHIIWKYQFGVYTSKKFTTSHYHLVYFCKDPKQRKFYPDSRIASGERTPSGKSARYQDLEDVWIINREYWQHSPKTPTKLPAEIIRKILEYTTQEGDLVLDPFLGSGQVAWVAREKNRQYIAYEIVEEYYAFAKHRLESNTYIITEEEWTKIRDK